MRRAPAAEALRLQVPEPPAPCPAHPAAAPPAPRPEPLPAKTWRGRSAGVERGCTRAAGVCGARAGAAGFWGSGVPQPGAAAQGGDTGSGKRKARGSSGALSTAGWLRAPRAPWPREGDPSSPPPPGGGPCVPSRASAWVGVPSLVHCGPLSFCIPDRARRVAPLAHVPPSPLGNPLFPLRILMNGPSGSGPGTLLVGKTSLHGRHHPEGLHFRSGET